MTTVWQDPKSRFRTISQDPMGLVPPLPAKQSARMHSRSGIPGVVLSSRDSHARLVLTITPLRMQETQATHEISMVVRGKFSRFHAKPRHVCSRKQTWQPWSLETTMTCCTLEIGEKSPRTLLLRSHSPKSLPGVTLTTSTLSI